MNFLHIECEESNERRTKKKCTIPNGLELRVPLLKNHTAQFLFSFPNILSQCCCFCCCLFLFSIPSFVHVCARFFSFLSVFLCLLKYLSCSSDWPVHVLIRVIVFVSRLNDWHHEHTKHHTLPLKTRIQSHDNLCRRRKTMKIKKSISFIIPSPRFFASSSTRVCVSVVYASSAQHSFR